MFEGTGFSLHKTLNACSDISWFGIFIKKNTNENDQERDYRLKYTKSYGFYKLGALFFNHQYNRWGLFVHNTAINQLILLHYLIQFNLNDLQGWVMGMGMESDGYSSPNTTDPAVPPHNFSHLIRHERAHFAHRIAWNYY